PCRANKSDSRGNQWSDRASNTEKEGLMRIVAIVLVLFVSATTAAAAERSEIELRRLIADYQSRKAGDATAVERIDRMAGQVGALQSRLFWYTDLDEAITAARAANKPILSLRLLGRLDEELSCANSRFFRKMLYVDPAINQQLRERF